MDAQHERILYLLTQFENGEATVSELDELDEWYASFEGDAKYTTELSTEKQAYARENLLARIEAELDRLTPQRRPVRRLVISRWLIAASVIFAIGTGSYWYLHRSSQQVNQLALKPDAQPGGNKAVLTLAGGQKILLTGAKNGLIASQGGMQITKTSGGQIVYQASAIPAGQPGSQLAYNTISTPNGGQFRVILPDGSKVFLNAASSLRYPVAFNGKERQVELTGEAYFEVAHHPGQPFTTVTRGQVIEDIGTHFDINAYADEPAVRTTLAEGAVRVNGTTLAPGQQAVSYPGDPAVKVSPADLDETLAWKNGLFQFDNTDGPALMRQLARWYNLEIVYEGSLKNKHFYGSIERSYTLADVLKVLELGKVKFRMEKPTQGSAQKKLIIL